MPDITCPVCGEVNSADQEFCQYCQSRLQPLTGPLKGADAPIQPGQMPTRKNTAELEPILPQWLRDARDKARKNAEEQAAQDAEESAQEANASPPDLLAGLRSQTDAEEDDTPDWLVEITGAKQKSKKPEGESADVRWVELGKPEDFSQQEEEPKAPPVQPPAQAEESELPPWLSNMQSEQGSTDELAWLRESESTPEPPAEKPAPFTEADLGSGSEASSSSEEPLPDWLMRLQAEESAAAEIPPTEAPQEIETDTDWLKKLESEASSAGDVSPELPPWLKEETPASESEETPAWLRSAQTFSTESEPPPEEAQPAELPSWLKTNEPTPSSFSEEPAATPSAGTETPDWLSTLQSQAGLAPEHEKPEETPAAFTRDALTGENADALFTEMPDWLSGLGGRDAGKPSDSTPLAEAEPIAPGELPSWVQAMRPVEAGESQGVSGGDQTLEARGALAGLPGVLPAVPPVSASSKPKAYSIKLNADDDQVAQSMLLEQILAAETAPEPIASFSPLAAQRGLRWVLAALLIVIVTAAVFLRPGFALPSGESNAVRDARVIMEVLPPSAPVLVVVDYEPALAGEMEAVAAPLLEHAIILRQPMLTFISTSPTGGLLAERLMTGPLKERGYQRGSQYLNLGYLPGGLTGVRAFSQNPAAAAPFAMESTLLNPVLPWQAGPLQGVTSLSQFAAMIVITDNAESARTWVEQTAFTRGPSPIIMVSSAQAAPMIQPYYDSRQVSAVVSGLYGGAIIGQSNGGLPSLAQGYWDAFSLGLLLTVVMIAIGGLWNLALGLRDRRLEGK